MQITAATLESLISFLETTGTPSCSIRIPHADIPPVEPLHRQIRGYVIAGLLWEHGHLTLNLDHRPGCCDLLYPPLQ